MYHIPKIKYKPRIKSWTHPWGRLYSIISTAHGFTDDDLFKVWLAWFKVWHVNIDRIPMQVTIRRCPDPLMWYAKAFSLGRMAPVDVVRFDREYIWARDFGGHLNIVHYADVEDYVAARLALGLEEHEEPM